MTSTRYNSIDALRGLIMIIMAIDHASAFIARQHASEFWAGAMSAYTSWFPFLTRAITHLCAPGFFFLMGAGVYWYAASASNAVRRTVTRGLVLFLLAQVVEVPIMLLQGMLPAAKVSLNQISAPPPNDGTAMYWGFITLSGLGLVLIMCGLLLRLRPWMWLAVSALCVLATNSMLPASGKPGAWWMAVLARPGTGAAHHRGLSGDSVAGGRRGGHVLRVLVAQQSRACTAMGLGDRACAVDGWTLGYARPAAGVTFDCRAIRVGSSF